jgi:hypothetical protein
MVLAVPEEPLVWLPVLLLLPLEELPVSLPVLVQVLPEEPLL